MRRSLKAAVALAALGVTIWGLSGAYSYGQDYNLHRGFARLVQLPRAGTGRLLDVDFYSRALHRRADYLAYLPPGYTPARRYPVYYLLHGMPGQPHVFVTIANMDVRLDNQMSLGRARPMILVYPDGRIGGSVYSDSEWANTRAGAFESYVLEVVRNVDHRFATLRNRRDRVIGGFSAGAYGAVDITLHHLAQFASVQSWSGYYTQTPTGVFAHASAAQLASDSPLAWVRAHGRTALARHPLRAYLFVGRDDGSSVQQLPMVRALRARGARVRYRLYPGGHDWSVWYPRLNAMLDLASWDMLHPPRGVAARRGVPAARERAGPRRAYVVAPAGGYTPPPAPAAALPRPHHHHRSELRLLGALLLALLSAALINLGFVLQHRGHARARADGRDGLMAGLRTPAWLGGQALGWIGFAGATVAVALAPLTLVQAFAAGSLAVSVPLAARLLHHRIPRRQLIAVALIALSLASLPIGFGSGHGHLRSGALIGAVMVASVAGIALGLVARTATRAIAAGIFYGVADAAIKADALGLHHHGAAALLSGWTVLAALGTLGGFLTFQGALRDEDAVQPLTLMNAFTAITAVALGMGAFREPLGTTTATSIAHGLAIVVVLACVRPLARAQQRLVLDEPASTATGTVDAGAPAAPGGPPAAAPAAAPGGGPDRGAARGPVRPSARGLLAGGAGLGAALAVIVACLAGTGLLYALRGLHWLALGPSVPDALPLLQLAGFAGQPLARVAAAWVPIGVALGIALGRLAPERRLLAVGIPAAALLLIASDASYALTRNLRLEHVLLNRSPGLGPWVQALLLAAACAVPDLARRAGAPSVEIHSLGRA